jgi:enoyl-[acyl-carrier protein] reductase II
MVLVPQVVDSVQVPVVAAGGIADGRGLVAAFALGAQGVQMGTRFICSDECIAHPRLKERIVQADDRSTVVTMWTTGYAVRSLENRMTQQFSALEKAGATKEELDWFGRGRTYQGLVEGDVDEGWLLSGQSAGLIKEIKPVKAIIEEIVAEAEAIISAIGRKDKLWLSR